MKSGAGWQFGVKRAPGGAKSYVKGGLMTEGYALVAWPEQWAKTGVMTFVVGKGGTLYQKNLGPGTAAAKAIAAFDPDATWEKVAPPK